MIGSPIDALRELFRNPTNAYRHLTIIHELLPGNHVLWDIDRHDHEAELSSCRETIAGRIREFAKWGFGGIVANVSREGYLENEQAWDVFVAGVDAAAEAGFRFWIYDEEGYPSGSAGGIVLRDHPEFEAQGLTVMREDFGAGEARMRAPSGWMYSVRALAEFEDGRTVDVTDKIGPDGTLAFDADTRCTVTRFDARRAYEGTHATRNVHQFRRYINVLQQEAVDYFYEVTDQQYIDRLGDRIKHVEAVFTDEPSFMTTYFHDVPDSLRGKVPTVDEFSEDFDRLPMIPWEATLAEKFQARWGYDLLPEIGRLFAGDSPRDLRVRHDFYQMLSEVYAKAFFESQQKRLKQHGVEFSGHVLCEESLPFHVACQGNVMANLKQMGIPGVDMLCSIPEDTLDSIRMLTMKYGSSAAHVAGREQVMCESSEFEEFVTGRKVTIEQRRAAVSLQMALGVTTITSYFPWHNVEPEARRGTLDSWARLATILRHGTHIADIAVLYPIRAAWASFKPVAGILGEHRHDEPLNSMDANLQTIGRRILASGMDFDFIDTRDLIGSESSDGRMRIANESYSTLVIPPSAAMCPKDLEMMERFVASGGQVIAFEPLSEFAIPEISRPPTGVDLGPGRSPAQVISQLAADSPERVRVFPGVAQGSRIDFAASGASDDVRIELAGIRMVARRSVYEDTDFVLIVNAGSEDAAATVDFGPGRTAELWDPWTGEVSDLASSDVLVPGYSAIVAVSPRLKADG